MGYPGPGIDLVLLDHYYYGKHVVPAIGAAGGFGTRLNVANNQVGIIHGCDGQGARGRQTGGGGTGPAGSTRANGNNFIGMSGSGSAGTSWSGGNGGGAGAYGTATDATYYVGGNGFSVNKSNAAAGGTGVSPGSFSGTGCAGNTGAGGLLVCYCNDFYNQGVIQSCGIESKVPTQSLHRNFPGGTSGGGSINIFYQHSYKNVGSIYATGGAMKYIAGDMDNYIHSGAGGNGSVTITFFQEDVRKYILLDSSFKHYVNNKWLSF